ncbi:hypothetical protein SLS60_004955 [Paraconiothyrium brasiliense]|uniref:NmrA-like domain-containing protein n=1 Tax=Paraconiothyrium brasiliense TaxID=300254 RepID=A0ABR3RLT7_9PLEO
MAKSSAVGILLMTRFGLTDVLIGEGSTKTFPDNVKVVRANFDSFDSLKAAFQGQDAVVSLVASEALAAQIKLIDAAIAAGVERYIPSEFGSNTADPLTLEAVPLFKGKIDIQEYLKSKESEISRTIIVTGPFFGELSWYKDSMDIY